ncbi:MAG: glycosyltransferase family 39 protein [Candidatus Buchananbacteria bacterium]
MKAINLESKKVTAIFFLFLIALTFFLYWPNLSAYFVSDDFEWIYASYNKNPLTFFVTNSFGQTGFGNYGPLVNLAYYFSYQLGRLNPLPYHLFSLFFHLGNLALIYFITKHFFSKKPAMLAALGFAVYFNNAEAVAWIAAIPHVMATFFYLLSVFFWLKFFQTNKNILYLFSLLAFIFGLLTKEIIITLPIIILILSLIQSQSKNIRLSAKKIFFWLSYFLVLALYLFYRQKITGVMFGYYGRSHFDYSLIEYLKNVFSLLVSLVSSGQFRSKLIALFSNHLVFAAIGFVASFCLALLFLGKKNLKLFFAFIVIFGAVLLPYISLLMNPLNNEGERYLYLPAIVVFIFLALALTKIKTKIIWFLLPLVTVLFFTSGYLLLAKNNTWQLSGTIAKQIVSNFSGVVDLNQKDKEIYFLYLPDNLNGTQVFRNSIKQAIKLNYPDYDLKITVLSVYIMLDQNNWQQPLFAWKNYKTNKILGKTISGQKIITGFDRRESDDLIFELWGYDYKYFYTDSIFIEFKDSLIWRLQKEKVYLLYFDQGRLKLLDYQQSPFAII